MMPDPQQALENLSTLACESLKSWGFDGGHLSLIKHRENAVYRLDAPNGKHYALRIHRAHYHSDVALRSELQWMQALAEYGISVPAVVPTDSGDFFAKVAIANLPETRQVDLFQWVEGKPLGAVDDGLGADVEQIRAMYLTVGEIAGKLHKQACQWQLPEGFERHAWDENGLLKAPVWGPFWALEILSPAQRLLINKARDKAAEDLQRYGKSPDNYSMIHADFAPENFLVEGDVVRLIDFDDAGFGWHLFELATALYFIQQDPNYQIAYEALIEGYRQQRELPEQALRYLSLFLALRGFTYLGWIHSRKGEQVAIELAPMLVELACASAERYLSD